MAFYSDRHSIFHVQARDRAEGGAGLSQFGRALRDLNIDSLCANSPQAKGRVERANGTLQDRLVKELRLRGLDDSRRRRSVPVGLHINRRFAGPCVPCTAIARSTPTRTWPRSRPGDAADPQEPAVHYQRDLSVLEDAVANRRLRGATALLSEAEDGTLTIRANGRVLASTRYPKDQARLAPGEVVDHKRLDGVFAWIAVQQRERDAARLVNPKITLRDKKRIQAATALSPA
jgi:hypothetical protein